MIVALHGFLGSPKDWDSVKTSWGADLLCPFLPGHGLEPILGTDFESCVEQFVERVLHQHPGLHFTLVGYSMGGRIALYIALKFPALVKRLILISSSPGIIDPVEKNNRLLHDLSIAKELEDMPYDFFLDVWYSQPIFKSLKEHPAFSDVLKRRMDNDPMQLAKAIRFLSVGNQPSLWHDLYKLECPTLLLTGDKDTKYHGLAKNMAETTQAIYWKEIQNAGHALLTESPHQVADAIKLFLKEHP